MVTRRKPPEVELPGVWETVGLWCISQFKPGKKWRSGKYYVRWAKHVKNRAGNRCQITGVSSTLVAHHLDDASTYYTKRYSLSNGICICKRIHAEFHEDYMGGYHVPCTKQDFINFMNDYGYELR